MKNIYETFKYNLVTNHPKCTCNAALYFSFPISYIEPFKYMYEHGRMLKEKAKLRLLEYL